jgi:hypothetical protein
VLETGVRTGYTRCKVGVYLKMEAPEFDVYNVAHLIGALQAMPRPQELSANAKIGYTEMAERLHALLTLRFIELLLPSAMESDRQISERTPQLIRTLADDTARRYIDGVVKL